MRSYLVRSVLGLSVCLVSFTCVFSQTDAKNGKPEELKIRRNVLITDRAGSAVESIKPADLKIFEDGQEQQISDLKFDGSPLSLVMVFDNTGSMRPYLDAITATGMHIIRNLRPADEVEVIRFVDRPKIEVVASWTTDRLKLVDAIENLFIDGGQSAVVDALMRAASEVEARKRSYPTRRFAVLLISDCEDRDSFFNKRQLAERARAVNVPFFVIGYPNELSGRLKRDAVHFSYDLPLATGGSAYFPRDKDTSKLPISESLAELLVELRAQYVVSYVPANQVRDGTKRTVKIERSVAGSEQWLIATKSAYTVPKPN